VHLVDAHPFQTVGGGLDRVQQGDRLTVGQGDDQVGTGSDVVEDGPGGDRGRVA
jgi:hypothetical protein